MIVFIVILLLLAALFGVLGAVLKLTLVIVLSILLTIATLGVLAYGWLRYRLHRFSRDVERAYDDRGRRSLPPGP